MAGNIRIVYRTIATHLTHKAGYTNATAHTGAVTLMQRFGSALNLTRAAWPGIWNARACWNKMSSTVIWRWKAQMKTRWISCAGIPLPTV